MRYVNITTICLVMLVSMIVSPDAHALSVCEAHANAPNLQEGNLVPCQVDLNGNQRTLTSVAISTVTLSNNMNIASVANVAVPTGNLPVIVATGTNSIGSVLQGTNPWVTSLSGGNAVNATITSLPSLPTGVNTIGTVTVAGFSGGAFNATITGVNGAAVASVNIVGCLGAICAAPGQVTMASSTSVAIASDQSALPIMGFSATSLPSSSGNASGTRVMTDKFGRVVIAPQGDRALATRGVVTISTTTETTLIRAGGSGIFNDITSLFCSNRDNASSTRVDIRDTTGGSIIHSGTISNAGGGFVLPFYVPLPQTSANATWTAQLSVNVAGGVDCNFVAVQNK